MPQYFELTLQRQIKIGNFVQITRLMICMIFGLLGGVITRSLVERRGFDGADAEGRRGRVGIGARVPYHGNTRTVDSPGGRPAMAEFAARILKLVSEPDYRPITLKAMSRRFEVGPDDYAEFRATVKGLVKEGKLDLAKDRKLRRPEQGGAGRRAVPAIVEGLRVRPTAQVGRPVGPDLHPARGRRRRLQRRRGRGQDHQAVASGGDERRGAGRPDPGPRLGLFVGTYFEEGGAGFVQIDGTNFQDPIDVGDPGAKGAKPGDKVAVEIVRYPTPYLEGEGVITEILGQRGQPGVDTLTVIRAFNIPDTFDEGVLDEAREQARQFDESQIGNRTDLRDFLTVTIDPATARDFDDAISLSRDEQGLLEPGGPHRRRLALRPGRVRPGPHRDGTAAPASTCPIASSPCCPEVLSNSLASLQAGRTRYTVTAFLEFNSEGILTSKRFARSAIRADHRFSYEEAFAVMKAPEAVHPGVTPEVARMLGQMLELAMILRRRRFARGALELNLPEVAITWATTARSPAPGSRPTTRATRSSRSSCSPRMRPWRPPWARSRSSSSDEPTPTPSRSSSTSSPSSPAAWD